MVASFVGNWFLTLLNGAIRGIGQQSIAAKNNLFAYYLIYIPLAIYLAFDYNQHQSIEEESLGQSI